MSPDPYRVLGVERGTPLPEIKRAYRRLAKANHPDSGGPAALPRFLEIQAAYEEIVEGRPRTSLGGTSSGPGPAGPAWRGDPDRARATREAWRRRTSRPGGTAGSPGGSAGSPGSTDRPPAGAPGGRRTGARGRDRPPGSEDTTEGGATSGGPRSRREGRNRATMGSTTYDGADGEAFDATWGGASWYGPTSGTYWTINPKEYADPRKHGPEYQARARRGTGAGRPEEMPDDAYEAFDARPAGGRADPTNIDEGSGGDAAADSGYRGQGRGDRRSARGEGDRPEASAPDGSRFGAAESGRGESAEAESGRGGLAGSGEMASGRGGLAGSGEMASGRAASRGADVGAARSDSAPTGGPRTGASARDRAWPTSWRSPGRILGAVIAWPPLGLAAALIHGELTGCARFAASCSDPTTPWPWIFQVAILAALVALPGLARVAVAGTYAIVVVITPVTLFLTAGGGYDPERSTVLLFASLAAAWLAGVAIAISRGWRREATRPHVP